MKITKEWIEKWQPCREAIKWVDEKYGDWKQLDAITVLEDLIADERLDWANWTIVRCMTRKQSLRYATYAAKQVLPIFEDKYPDDKRPRLAIRAAEKCLKSDTKNNRYAAWDAARAAWNAGNAAGDAWDAGKEMRIKILRYGIKLLKTN